MRESGPCRIEETRVGFVFRGDRRIFGSAKPGRDCVRGHLVLPERIVGDPRFTTHDTLTKRLHFNGFRIEREDELDETFRRHVAAACAVGAGSEA